MAEWVMGLIGVLLCLLEGYCIQSFFGRFAEFLAVQFISLRELSFWAGYSLLYIVNEMIEVLVYKAGTSAESAEYLPAVAGILSCFGVALVGAARCALLFVSTRKIAGSYCSKGRGRMGREVIFYLLPSVAGVLVSVLVRLLLITVTDGTPVLLYEKYPALYLIIPLTAFVLLGAVVFSFRIYQDMAALQEERAEKIVLENQITQMQSSMVEMEHLYDGIRSVKHDMKNHMAVLQNLIRKKYSGEDEEIRQYFEGMYQSVEQLDSRVHTGNAVSDAVVGSKFRYAAKKIKGIKLDAKGFMLSDAVTIKAYDMGIILNNGLDNAIEACIRMREKQPDAEAYITIRSFTAKNMYFIEIENSFDGSALSRKDSGLPISTKEDKEVHGIGLKNIRKCAVKYGGDLDCIVKGNKFTLSVMVKS